MSISSRLILVTNDDGYQAPGIRALIEAVRPLGEIVVVAPEVERSGTGHGITLFHPLRMDLQEEYENVKIYSCNGTPTDCVSLAIHYLLKGRPNLLVSGINSGGNLGDDITYSGTVMAAMEGASQGIPSFGISLVTSKRNDDYSTAASFAREFARNLIDFPIPEEVFFSINVPAIPREDLAGVEVTKQGRSVYHQKIEERQDPWGRNYYWISGLRAMGREVPGSDFEALKSRKISVTPLQICMTSMEYVDELSNWDLFRKDVFEEKVLGRVHRE